MKKYLIKLFLFICFTFVMSYIVYYFLYRYQKSYYSNTMKTRWIITLKNRHADYLFLGSSRMANMIAVHQLDSSLNSQSINIATAGSSYGESYVLFNEFLKNGNTTKTLILTYDLFKNRHDQADKEAITPLVFKHFELFPIYKEKDVYKVYADFTDKWKLYVWDYIPFARYAEFNNYFNADSAFSFIMNHTSPKPSFDTLNGEQLIHKSTFKGEKRAAPGVIQMGPRGWKYLLAIVNLAKQHKIKIILVTAPYYKVETFNRNTHYQYLDFMRKQYQVDYLDFSKQDIWKNSNCFADAIHTNEEGSRLFTKELSDSLKIR